MIAVMGRIGLLIKKVSPGIYRRIKPYFPDNYIFVLNQNKNTNLGKDKPKKKKKIMEEPSQIDERYSVGLDEFIHKIQKEHKYDAVIAEYVFTSRALLNFDKNVLKIIDTHDVFTNRNSLHESKGIYDDFFSTTKEEEAKGLNRADKIIAIQEKERNFLKQITEKEVSVVGHITKMHDFLPKNKINKEILFVGTGNKSNIQGVGKFIRDIFPQIKKEIKGVKLILCGKICDFIKESDGIIKLGEVGDLTPVYNSADVVINPVYIGTGLKIKNIESLSYNRPLITSRHGAEGMPCFGDESFFVADTPEEYISLLKDLFFDIEFYNESSSDAHKYCKKYNESMLKNLESLFI